MTARFALRLDGRACAVNALTSRRVYVVLREVGRHLHATLPHGAGALRFDPSTGHGGVDDACWSLQLEHESLEACAARGRCRVLREAPARSSRLPRERPPPRVPLTYRGKTRSVAQWAERTGLPAKTIYDRIARGLPPDRVLAKASVRPPKLPVAPPEFVNRRELAAQPEVP